jgi:transcription antitermination factor NusG
MESIDSLKIMVLNSQEILIGFKYKRGDLVRVVSGPFVGVLGEFVRYRGKGRVVVSIAALGQNAAVNVSEDDIEMIRDNLLITA